ARRVADADEVALAVVVRRGGDHAVGGGHHRRSRRRGVIDAVMRAEVVQQRMEAARRELRTDAAELQRRAQELFAERSAVARVVAGTAVRVAAEGFESLAIVREARGHDRSVAGDVGSGELLLHDEAEGVALLQSEEIDVPLENVDELLDELRRFAGAAERLVK